MHEAGGDGPDQDLSASIAVREGEEDPSTSRRPADSQESAFRRRMTIVRPDREGALEHGLDLGDRDAVPLALLAVPRVPVEPRDRLVHAMILYDCICNVKSRRHPESSAYVVECVSGAIYTENY